METYRAELTTRTQILLGIGLVLLIFVARLLPHFANFTPVVASGIFAGVYLRKSWALLIPALGLFLSNIFLPGNSFTGNSIVISAVILSGVFGRIISRKKMFQNAKFLGKIWLIFGGTLASSLAFFLITNCNFLYNSYGMYPLNFAGLMESYAAGIPFFRSQILGDFVYVFALFGAMETAIYLAKNRKFAKISA